MPKCRLLYLVGQLHTGGLEQQLCYLLQAMDRDRYLPSVVVWNHRETDLHVPEVRKLGIPLYYFPEHTSPISKLIGFCRLMKQLQPEVVHSYNFYTNVAAYLAAKYTNAVAVGSIRNDFILDKKWSGPVLGRLSARWPREQICNSHQAARNAEQSRGFFGPRRTLVVRNGLDLDRFQPYSPMARETVRILGIGYLLPAKRWDRLLVAAAKLKQRGFRSLIQIAGDGPLEDDLKGEALKLGVTDYVHFLGHRSDVSTLLCDSAFLVHTSDNEGCPNAVMEAMACGRPVVAMEAGDIPSLVEDGKTGFVVSRGDVDSLVEQMAKLIVSFELQLRMGQAGRAKAVREFGLIRLVEETLNAYRLVGWKDSLSLNAASPISAFVG